MNNRVRLSGFFSIVSFVLIGWGSPVVVQAMDLVGMLTKNLGVTNQQAGGGAGSIFNAASQKMSVDDFSKVTDAMPEVQSLMNAAPQGRIRLGNLRWPVFHGE